MKFETMLSGVRVTGCDIKLDPMFDLTDPLVSLSDINSKITKEDTIQFIFLTYRFTRCEIEEGVWQWCTLIAHDDLYKIHILERRSDYADELCRHVGKDWLYHYIRFNH